MDNLGKIAWRKLVFHAVPCFHRFVSFPDIPQVSHLRSSSKKSVKESVLPCKLFRKYKGCPQGAHCEKAATAEQIAEGRDVLQETYL